MVKLLQYPVGKLRYTLVSDLFWILQLFNQNILLKFGKLQVDGGKLNFNSQVCFGTIKNPQEINSQWRRSILETRLVLVRGSRATLFSVPSNHRGEILLENVIKHKIYRIIWIWIAKFTQMSRIVLQRLFIAQRVVHFISRVHYTSNENYNHVTWIHFIKTCQRTQT